MTLKIDINRKQLEHVIDMGIASSRRAINTAKRPEFTELYLKDINELTAARASIEDLPSMSATAQRK